MYPEQNQPEPNYSFILNSEPPKRRILNPGSKGARIMLMGGMVFGLIVLFVIFSSLLGASSRKASANLVDLAAYQSELSRVVGLGIGRSREIEYRNKAITASYTLKTHSQVGVSMAKARGVKLDKKQLAKYTGSTTDAKLNDAEKSNNFDEVYKAVYEEKLEAYKAKLASVYPTLSPKEQATVKVMNEAATTLLK